MTWVDVVVLVVLFLSLITGLMDGAVKHFFGLVALVIAIFFSGILYTPLTNVISFLPDSWPGFIAFFIIFGILVTTISIVFLIPAKIIHTVWREGVLSRLLGGGLNLLGSAISLVVFTLVLNVYPIFAWLRDIALSAATLQFLVLHLPFVQALLPPVFRLPSGVFAVLGSSWR